MLNPIGACFSGQARRCKERPRGNAGHQRCTRFRGDGDTVPIGPGVGRSRGAGVSAGGAVGGIKIYIDRDSRRCGA